MSKWLWWFDISTTGGGGTPSKPTIDSSTCAFAKTSLAQRRRRWSQPSAVSRPTADSATVATEIASVL
jgi:hypothetical protein